MSILRPEQVGEAYIDYKANILAIEKRPMKIGEKKVEFEKALRSPGVRTIIDNGEAILLTKEYREEQEGYDYRTPGGKVFDKLETYLARRKEDCIKYAKKAAKRECQEETGICIEEAQYFSQTCPTATMEFTLYFFTCTKFTGQPQEQNTHEGEHILPEWVSYETVSQWCLDGTIGEEFTALNLLRYLHKKSL